MRLPTVERKIYFYRVDIGRDEGGRPLRFDPDITLQILRRLPFTISNGGRYEEEPDGNVLCGIPSNGDAFSLRFCRIRRVGLPQLERLGKIQELDIDADTGLLEPTHVVFFEGNIAGIEYNHYGPRASRLGPYLDKKVLHEDPSIVFYPLLRRDISEQLDDLTELRVFEFRIRPSYIGAVRQADSSLADALEANWRIVDDTDSLQVILKPSKYGRRSALNKLLVPIKMLLRQHDLYENVSQFKVRGYRNDTGRVETIDLLSNYVVASKTLLRQSRRGRSLESHSVLGAIREAYIQLKDDIDLAATIEND